ncbi:DUF998 domain-containing protein [Amycolatopsis sp. ATCC 39116]|uniref:DUF998 domain-containing protein n=1 Tax=Amycolatopsis sp. (strain ATCC 39116 / 75iv2) TaxID=385957 RepID=UPI0002628D56|nr:DUF998 domain-containing protein [Amycolatopsis sp. ATCC 39116]
MTTTALRPAASRLTALAVAGPLWATVSLAQAATRDGFDLTRQPLSLLSTGSLGWLQIANFVVAGVLTVAGANGLPGKWAPRLVLTAGVGLVAAGVFPMDAVGLSWHGVGHMIAGTVTFASLIAACHVLGRRFSGRDAVLSHLAGTALLVGDGWAMAGGPAGSLTLAVGAITAMLWISVVAARLR